MVLDRYRSLETQGISVLHSSGDGVYASIVLDSLEKGIPRVLSGFGMTHFPRVRAVVAPGRDEFDRLVRDLLQVEIEIPSHPARVAQAQKREMVLLSPAVYGTQSTFTYAEPEFRRLAVHEFVHMAEEFLSPDIEASPRWWGEGLAVYLSGQWRYEDFFGKPAQRSVTRGEPPELDSVLSGEVSAYVWGWTVVKCIQDRYGPGVISRLVRDCLDGDPLSLLDTGYDGFRKLWGEWIKDIGNLLP